MKLTNCSKMALRRVESASNVGNKEKGPNMTLRRISSDSNIGNKIENNSVLKNSSKPIKDPPILSLEPLYPKEGLSKFNHLNFGLRILISSKKKQEKPFLHGSRLSKSANNIVLRSQMIKLDMSALYPPDMFLKTCFFCKTRLNLGSVAIYIYKGESSFCTAGCRRRGIFADFCARIAATENTKPEKCPKSTKGTIFFIKELKKSCCI